MALCFVIGLFNNEGPGREAPLQNLLPDPLYSNVLQNLATGATFAI